MLLPILDLDGSSNCWKESYHQHNFRSGALHLAFVHCPGLRDNLFKGCVYWHDVGSSLLSEVFASHSDGYQGFNMDLGYSLGAVVYHGDILLSNSVCPVAVTVLLHLSAIHGDEAALAMPRLY
jgi:hypothetical protein